MLWWLIGGTRGGKNRVRIINALKEKPMNANQLSKELNLDYKTIRHHVEILEENQILTIVGEGYGNTYFLSDQMEENFDLLTEITDKIGD
ncbi:MAG: winged helix-turn-helix domain-containing protein [Euryarchaeota archaeon]|nr:winged helix-turn-helix domain-containing protein [Euryarchaeota archaeon]